MSLEVKYSSEVGSWNAADPERRYGGVILHDNEGNYIDVNQTKWQRLAMAGKGFAVITGFINVAGAAETDFMLIRNPSSSGILVMFKEFIMTLRATTTQFSTFRFYRTPTITDVGTPLIIGKVLTLSSNVSKILAYQTPTISNRGTLIQPFNIGTETFVRDQDLGRFLASGSDILVSVHPSQGNIEHNVSFLWAEEEI